MRNKHGFPTQFELEERGRESDRSIQMLTGVVLVVIVLAMFGLVLLFVCSAHAEPIDMTKIAMIESSNNYLAWNKKDDSRGTFQITPICLREYNNFHPRKKFKMNDLWNPAVNRGVAEWYLNERIPQMLKCYKLPDTIESRIICYNAGIGRAITYYRGSGTLPEVTKAYIRKYNGGTK